MAAASASLIAFPEEVAATSRTMLAPGAIAWAYSTSRLVSMLHPKGSWGFPPKWPPLVTKEGVVHPPGGQIIVKDGGGGRRNTASKRARSFEIVGLPYASTMTIVWPDPSKSLGKL